VGIIGHVFTILGTLKLTESRWARSLVGLFGFAR